MNCEVGYIGFIRFAKFLRTLSPLKGTTAFVVPFGAMTAFRRHGDPRVITLDGFEPTHAALCRMGMNNEIQLPLSTAPSRSSMDRMAQNTRLANDRAQRFSILR